jgi:endonuclease III
VAKRLRLPEVVDLLEKAYGKPRTAEHPEAPLLDHLLVGVLTAWGDREKAGRALRALSESFLDLNEARVSPIAELTAVLHPFLGARAEEAAHALRTALQDVYDGTHGLDLEPLRGRDPDDLKKFLKELPHTLGGPAAAVFQLALGTEHLALTVAEHRVLERLKVLPLSPNPQKVRVALEKQIKPADRLAFVWAVGSHAQAVCRAKDPACETCALLVHCPVGEAEVKRREAERKKEEARLAVEEKKRKVAEEKAAREAAKKQAVEDKKRKLAEEKAARIAAAKAAAEKKAKAEAEKKAKAKAEVEAQRKARAEAEKKAKAAAARAKKSARK